MNTKPLETIEIATGPAPSASVIWMHGLGADGNDFAPLADEIELPIGVRYIFPHAPMMPVSINGGYVMRAWYDISDAAIRREDEAGVRASQAAIEQLIAAEVARGIPASRIVLAGFSQGGAVAFQTGLRHPQRLAGIMALSTYLPLAGTVEDERSAANRDLPVFMAHGSVDPVISISRAQQSRKMLEALGYPLEWHEYPMPHSVCPQEITDISDWLVRTLT